MNGIYFDSARDDFVMDEMCDCGHLKSEHGSTLIRNGGAAYRAANDGSCCCPDCTCAKFTWVRNVFIDEFAAGVIRRRPCHAQAS